MANPADAPSCVLDRSNYAFRDPGSQNVVLLWTFCLRPDGFTFECIADPFRRASPLFLARAASVGCRLEHLRSALSKGPLLCLPAVYSHHSAHKAVHRVGLRRGGDGVTGVSSSTWALVLLHPYIKDYAVLCPPSSVGVLLFPTISGYGPNLPLPFGFMTFRCRFPRSRLPLPSPLTRDCRMYLATRCSVLSSHCIGLRHSW